MTVNISLTSGSLGRTVPPVATIDIGARSASTNATLWQSTIGKKAIMAVTGLVMVLFLVLHMLGNLKIFFGPHDFDAYASWLRGIGEPVLHGVWFLWIQRAVLLVAVVLHIVCAAQLSKRDLAARPTGYAHGQRPQASFATRTMRWGGVILALFIIWHLLDLTAGVTNPHFDNDKPHLHRGGAGRRLAYQPRLLERLPDARNQPTKARRGHSRDRDRTGRGDHLRLSRRARRSHDGTGALT
jgi:succinate dehydrogenase/fumarate reductase cytochrome b subunit (b558 family)